MLKEDAQQIQASSLITIVMKNMGVHKGDIDLENKSNICIFKIEDPFQSSISKEILRTPIMKDKSTG